MPAVNPVVGGPPNSENTLMVDYLSAFAHVFVRVFERKLSWLSNSARSANLKVIFALRHLFRFGLES
ncbi:hypothetical protein AAE478_004945 [Parahypoxylon ruwenzoriense]